MYGPQPAVRENVPDRACGRVVAFARVGGRGSTMVSNLRCRSYSASGAPAKRGGAKVASWSRLLIDVE